MFCSSTPHEVSRPFIDPHKFGTLKTETFMIIRSCMVWSASTTLPIPVLDWTQLIFVIIFQFFKLYFVWFFSFYIKDRFWFCNKSICHLFVCGIYSIVFLPDPLTCSIFVSSSANRISIFISSGIHNPGNSDKEQLYSSGQRVHGRPFI